MSQPEIIPAASRNPIKRIRAEEQLAEEYTRMRLAQAALASTAQLSLYEGYLSNMIGHAAPRFKAIVDTYAKNAVKRVGRYE